MMKKTILLSLLIFIFLFIIFVPDVSAQCPMCRIAAESNLQHGGTAGKGLNKGILYMLALPYLLVGGIGYMWYQNRKKSSNKEFED